jgi:hypothetical protein
MYRKEEHQSRENEKQRKRIKGKCNGTTPTKPNNNSSFSVDSYPSKGALPPRSIFTITTCQRPKTVCRQFLNLRVLATALHYVLPGRDVTADEYGVNQSKSEVTDKNISILNEN